MNGYDKSTGAKLRFLFRVLGSAEHQHRWAVTRPIEGCERSFKRGNHRWQAKESVNEARKGREKRIEPENKSQTAFAPYLQSWTPKVGD